MVFSGLVIWLFVDARLDYWPDAASTEQILERVLLKREKRDAFDGLRNEPSNLSDRSCSIGVLNARKLDFETDFGAGVRGFAIGIGAAGPAKRTHQTGMPEGKNLRKKKNKNDGASASAPYNWSVNHS